MTPKQFTRWIGRIYATEEIELDCDQIQNFLPAFVEAELYGLAFEPAPQVENHLLQCPHCQDIFQALYTVAELELKLAALPQPPEKFVPPFPTHPPAGEFVPVASD